MDEVQVCLAFVARREGKRSMPASRWAHVLSLDLGWMPPGAARELVAGGVAASLLRPEGDALSLTFDPSKVEIPIGFRGRPSAATAAPPTRPSPPAPSPPATGPAVAPADPATSAPKPVDPFLSWVARVAAATRADRAQVLAQVVETQAKMGGELSADAAILWLAARAGLDVRDAAKRLMRGEPPTPAP